MKKQIKFLLTSCSLYVVLIMVGCSGSGANQNFPDKDIIDTMVFQNIESGKWDTNIVKHQLKYNTEKKKYDTTDVYLKEQMKTH